MSSWGILGKPTPEKIAEWQSMPVGEFKKMVDNLKKKSKGKTISRHTVEVKEIFSEYRSAYVDVQAYDSNHALELAKEAKGLDWSDKKPDGYKYQYRVSQVWN